MSVVWAVLATYFILGTIAVVLLDIITKRVRNRLITASYDTQQLTGEGRKVAIIVTLGALWVLWPVLIYAALKRTKKEGDKDGS